MLTRQDKVKLVIELYKQDKNIREIAKEVHMSFGDIGRIIKNEFGGHENEKSKEAQAFGLFTKGLKPLNVVMKLNIKSDEVKRLYREYQSLRELERVNEICDELGDDIESFTRLYKTMKEQGLGPKEVTNAVRYGNELSILELKYENTKEQLKQIENKKQNLISEQQDLEAETAVSKSIIANLDIGIQNRTNEIKSLKRNRQDMINGVLELMRTKEYKKVKEIAHREAETILNDKKVLLSVTLFAVLQAFKLKPESQILISTRWNSENNQSYFAQQQKNELLELAGKIQSELTTQLVNTTAKSVFN